ncbi:MAG: nucleotide sugar dehydrogenase [Anaerolineaceae bacterium]|nr:nucleotide sugar dehydrogenase [Anaerolineaceae bacterium]
MANTKAILLEKIKNKKIKVAVMGLGYVGLPFATVFSEAGFHVTGIDPIKEKVDQINAGISYIQDIPSEKVKAFVDNGTLFATDDFSILEEMDAVSICVPTPLRKTGDPDLSYIVSATEAIAPYLHKGMIIVLESSTYPGTTRELVLPRLTEVSGLEIGKDFFLAFSPERVDPGREDWTTKNTPKIVGGITEDCGEVASAWYCQALETVVSVSSTEVAEMAKLLENTFRMINIGLVNELAIMCDRLNVDVWEVIDAAATKPFGFMKFTPGPGLGGHCIPIDPLYLSWKLRSLNYTAKFIELASEINTGMPRFVVGKIQDGLNDHSKPINGSDILVLGVAYKPDIDDMRESPALDVIGLLKQKGAAVSYYDPYVAEVCHDDWILNSVENFNAVIKKADCVVIITNHTNIDYQMILDDAKLIVDTRNALGYLAKRHPKVIKL